MGTFRSLFTKLPCARCSRVRRTEIQFKAGNDRQQRYEQGGIVEESEGLDTDDEYEGCVFYYCADCYLLFQQSQAQITQENLARMVEEGTIELFRKGTSIHMQPSEIRKNAMKIKNSFKKIDEEFPLFEISFSGPDFDVKYRGAEAIFVFDLLRRKPSCTISYDAAGRITSPEAAVAWESFWNHLQKVTNDRMLKAGWKFGCEYLNTA